MPIRSRYTNDERDSLFLTLERPWYPVLLRYVELIAGRLQGVGGDPGAIPPSLGGYRPGRPVCEPGERREAFTGKVASVVYDRFGNAISNWTRRMAPDVSPRVRRKSKGS